MAVLITLALGVFHDYSTGKTEFKPLFDWPVCVRVLADCGPVNPPLRIACGLMSGATLGFAVLYFAKLIRISVWKDPPSIYTWGVVYVMFYFSLTLLYLVALDYQKFVHGVPSRTLPSGPPVSPGLAGFRARSARRQG